MNEDLRCRRRRAEARAVEEGESRWDGVVGFGDSSIDPWSVPFDDAFVAAAAVQEKPGAERVAQARRISAAHQASAPWRARDTAPRRQRRGRSRSRELLTALTVALVACGLLIGANELLQRRPQTAAVLASQFGDGSPVVPRPPDAQDARLLPPVTAPAGQGGYEPLHERRGRPLGFDPCRPVHWVMRADGSPPDALRLLTDAFARLSAATGLAFVYDGPTDEGFDEDRPLVQIERYGDRYAPVLVLWSDPDEADGLAGDVGGFAGPHGVDPDGAGPRYATGVVVLDAPSLAADPYEVVLGLVLHELGHLVGLDHVDDAGDTMHVSSTLTAGYTVGALRGLAAVGNGPCFSG